MNDAFLWSGLSLVAPLEARVSGPVPAGVTGVSIDTRTLAPGDLFFAIKGDNSDGHDHVRAAFEKQAGAAVIDEAHANDLRGAGALYVVKDTFAAMQRLGLAGRARSPAGVVAVTGSVGKTSTKEAMRTVFSAFGETHASAASYNNHWGVPLTLSRMPASARYGVFEIGMNHSGEILPLVAMVRPHVAVITTIAPVHLENLGSLEGIADAKAEIFTGLEPGGVAIVHRDAPMFKRLATRAAEAGVGEVLSFGEHEGVDARMMSCEGDDEGSTVTADVRGERLRFRLGAPGRHLATNALAVLLAAQTLGCDLREAGEALAQFHAPEGRGRQARLAFGDGEILLIDEAYNANPASMRAALSLLGAARASRRVAVLGDMLELGPDAAAMHADLAEPAAAQADLVFAAGPLMKNLFDALPQERRGSWAPTSADLEPALLKRIAPGDAVMIKGSNGSRMAPVVAAIRQFAAARADEV